MPPLLLHAKARGLSGRVAAADPSTNTWDLCPEERSPRNSSQAQGHGEDERDKQQFMLTFTPKATLETPVVPNM